MKWWLAVLLLLIAGVSGAEEPGTWELVGTKDGITVYRKDVPGSALVAFKGDGVVNAPLIKVVTILLDDDRAQEWVDSLVESKVVRVINPLEYIELNHIGMPPLFKDRDFVNDVRMTVDEAAHSFTMVYRSVDDPAMPPNPKYVRGDMMYSRFVMTSIEHGTKTRIEAELHADPKGMVPKFLVNFFQKDWPRQTFEGVRRQAAKDDIKRPATFADVLGQVERVTNW